MPFGRDVIFYEPLPDGIGIVRALHPARDIDAVFDPGPVWRSDMGANSIRAQPT